MGDTTNVLWLGGVLKMGEIVINHGTRLTLVASCHVFFGTTWVCPKNWTTTNPMGKTLSFFFMAILRHNPYLGIHLLFVFFTLRLDSRAKYFAL